MSFLSPLDFRPSVEETVEEGDRSTLSSTFDHYSHVDQFITSPAQRTSGISYVLAKLLPSWMWWNQVEHLIKIIIIIIIIVFFNEVIMESISYRTATNLCSSSCCLISTYPSFLFFLFFVGFCFFVLDMSSLLHLLLLSMYSQLTVGGIL